MKPNTRLVKAAKVARTRGHIKSRIGKWFCFIDKTSTAPKRKGYEIRPYFGRNGSMGGDPFTLATEAEVWAFGARPDVDLLVVRWVDEPAPTDQAR